MVAAAMSYFYATVVLGLSIGKATGDSPPSLLPLPLESAVPRRILLLHSCEYEHLIPPPSSTQGLKVGTNMLQMQEGCQLSI